MSKEETKKNVKTNGAATKKEVSEKELEKVVGGLRRTPGKTPWIGR